MTEATSLLERLTVLRDHIAKMDSGSGDAALLTEVISTLTGDGWRPISEAPRDGSYILVYPGLLGRPLMASWEKFGGWTTPEQHGWRATLTEKPTPYEPTHFHALPAPPPVSTEQGEG